MLDSREFTNELEELSPLFPLGGEDRAAFGRDLVVAAAALAGFLDPSALDPLALFQLVERRVQRGEVEGQRTARSGFDQLRQLVPVPRLVLEKREGHELGGAFFCFADCAGEFHDGGLYS